MEDTRVKKHHKSSGKHKHKKSKKHKHKKEKHSSSSGSDSDNGAVEWVEAPPPPAPKVEKRESWMQDESFVPTLTREQMTSGLTSREKKRQAEAKKREEEKEFMKSRELNPHWDKSGTGLPQDDNPQDEAPRLPNHSVGDGGYGHLVKARQRLQEQADREGRSMEDVAVERWGSLATLDTMIAEAEERMHQLSGNRHRKDRGSPDYRHSSEQSYKFQKPSNYDRHHRKSKNNVYSSRRSTSSSSSHYRDNSPDSEYSSRKNDDRKTSAPPSLYRDKSPDRKSSAIQREETSRQPAWKKVKTVEGEERKHHGSSSEKFNSEISSPSSSLYRDKSPDRKSPEMRRETTRQPAWKKAVDGENKHQASEDSSSPESPQMPSSSHKEEDTSNMSFNQLAAKRMRDALLGKVKPTRDEETVHNKPQETHRVMLTKMDSSGQQRPVTSSREDSGFERRTDRKQKRHKYFDDSSKYSLKQMFEREKLTTTADNIEMFMEVSAQCDDSLEDNETSDISKKAMQKMGHTNQEEKDIKKAIHQHQKLNLALEKCNFCLDKPNMKQHLIVTVQEQVFVCIPNFQTLTEGHCLIVPKRHVPSFLALDEDEWNGFQEALASVRRLFRSRGKSVLCMETSLHFGRCPHAYAECIPVPEEEGDLAPLYFKKSINESEEEWTHNVKLVDLTKKGLRRSIPKNLPYFAIFFDPAVHGGYAHVIEDEKAFPRNFGKEVVGGMLDIDYNYLYKNRREDPMKKSKEAAEFTKMWELFHGE